MCISMPAFLCDGIIPTRRHQVSNYYIITLAKKKDINMKVQETNRTINKFIEQVLLKPIKYNMLFFIVMYLLGMISTFLHVIVLNFKIPRINFFTWFFDIYILCIILTIAPRKIQTYLHLFFAFILYFFAIIDAFCVDKYRACLGSEIINVILETNQRESTEFLQRYINFDVLFSGVGIIILLIITHILFAFKHQLYSSLIDNIFKNIIVRLIIVISIISSFYISIPSRLNLVKFLCVNELEEIDNYVNNYTFNTPVNNLLFGLKLRQLADKDLGKMASYQQLVRIDSCSHTSPHIILIIGESYIKSHSQLYGYDKKTTPKQVQRFLNDSTGTLIPFFDVVTPANLTSIVFKCIFSFHSMDSKTNWSNCALFPVVFKQAGYQVCFITNQFVKDIKRDIFNASGGVFLNDSRLDKLQFDHRNLNSYRYDEGIIAEYDSLKKYQSDFSLTIFHLAGQHIDFCKRSPEDYKIFHIKDYLQRKNLSDSERQIIADYDNATLYNDHVVDSILQIFKDEESIVIYLADHGEECYDNIHRMGRFPKGNYSPQMIKNEYEIPFWIWYSNKYQSKHPEICQQISFAKELPFMIDDIPHLLSYLAGIHYQEYDERRNPLSPNYNSKRKRLLNGEINYDIIKLNNSITVK